MKSTASTGFARRLLVTVVVMAFAPVVFVQSSGAQVTANQTFFVLNNPNDPMFNQLLGINNGNVIVGYFGDGMAIANNGYVLVPPNHYSADLTLLNFTLPNGGGTASQIQAIGINQNSALAGATPFPDIVGFYTDMATGFTHGFLDSFGVQSTIDDPAGLPPNVTTPVQNLLGINNALRAAGFWTDNAGHEHGFVAEINTQTTPVSARFAELTPAKVSADLGVVAVATQTSDITNNNLVCGFWTDANDINHGFSVFFNTGAHRFNTVQALTPKIPNVKSLSPFGCNDNGEVVGSFTANDGTVHGFVFDGADWHNYDAAGSSQAPAFGVMGTFINGVNNAGVIVGFFSDGQNVNGFVDFAPVQ
jgi:probable HAF family extracellular repeat protein